MELQMSKVCANLISIKDKIEDNGELTDAILENKRAEDLFIALGMAIALDHGAITLNKTGENHLTGALQELNRIIDSIEVGDI